MQSHSDAPPTPDDVRNAYRLILGREPESDAAIERHLETATVRQVVANLAQSAEFKHFVGLGEIGAGDPFFHVNSSLDVRNIVLENVDHARQPKSGCHVNFLGVAVPTFVFDFLKGKEGQLDEIPIPSNYHADMAEWAAAIRSVDLAQDTFTMIELGSGWGCWMINTGFLAKRRGLKIELIGVEGDAKHIEFAHEVMRLNAIEPDEYSVVRGIAAPTSGCALFPKRQGDEERWGFSPVFGATEKQRAEAVATGSHDALDMLSLAEVIGDRRFIDLLHIDIQGGEGDLIDKTIGLLSEKVGYVLIGTHSRVLEGQIIKTMLAAGWELEIERPTIFRLVAGRPYTDIDGVQGWRNSKARRPL